MKKTYLTPVFLILTVVVFGVGFYFGKIEQVEPTPSDTIIINKELGQPEVIDFSLFWQVLKKIEEKYVDKEEIDYNKILYGATSGMAESLGDPYTVFMKPEKTESFVESVETGGSFEGVGMEIGIKGGMLTVIAPLEGTPAMKAGIKAGDKVLKIDDTFTDDLLLEEAVNLIRGEKGTEVVLTISRKKLEEPKEISIIRNVIQIPIAKWELKDNNIAYIKIYHFTGNLPDKFREIVFRALDAGAEKIILDFRNNPGGYLEVAVDIASWFIPKGEVVSIEDFGEEKTQKKYRSKGYKELQDFTVVVLINEGSASGSEIVAGALRDIRGAKLIGEKSFGKGSIQSLEKFRDGSSLKITVAKWLTPFGIDISEEGLTPDIEIELTEEDYNNNRDPQLNKAIEILKNL
jgi:carboxyl-terminal processing protease